MRGWGHGMCLVGPRPCSHQARLPASALRPQGGQSPRSSSPRLLPHHPPAKGHAPAAHCWPSLAWAAGLCWGSRMGRGPAVLQVPAGSLACKCLRGLDLTTQWGSASWGYGVPAGSGPALPGARSDSKATPVGDLPGDTFVPRRGGRKQWQLAHMGQGVEPEAGLEGVCSCQLALAGPP